MNSSTDRPDWSTLPESLRLLSLLWALDEALERTSRAMENTVGVTGPQRLMLRLIGLAPGITCEGLAGIMARDPGSLRSDLDALVANNLLQERRESAGYYLTGSGASVNAVMTGTVERAVASACDDASPFERMSFCRMVERVLRQLAISRA